MNVFTCVVLFLVSTAAAKKSGDDEWVHLPDKCEGKLSLFIINQYFDFKYSMIFCASQHQFSILDKIMLEFNRTHIFYII